MKEHNHIDNYRIRWSGPMILLLAGMILIAGCSGQDMESTSIVPQGREVYLNTCAACHGPNGEGQRPDAPLQRDETGRYPAPPHDETGHTWHHDDDLLIQIIKAGGMGGENFYEMPAFGDQLSDDEILAVIAYIKTLWTDEQRANQQQVTDAVRQQ